MRIEHGRATAAAAQRDHSFAALDLHAHPLTPTLGVFPRIKKTRYSALEGKVAVDAVAGDGSHRLGRLAHVVDLERAAFVRNVRRHPRHIAGKQAHHIERVRPQHDHVLAAAAPILFAVGANGLHRADPPLRQHLLYVPD